MKGRHQKVRRNLPGAGAWQPGNPVPRKNTGCRSPASLRGLHRGLRVDKRRRMCWWASRVDVSGKQVEGQGRGAKTAWAGDGVWEASTWLTAEGSIVVRTPRCRVVGKPPCGDDGGEEEAGREGKRGSSQQRAGPGAEGRKDF